MIKITDYVFTGILIFLGAAHTALTPLFYRTFDINALWFAGTGLAFIFLGFINLFRIRTKERFITILCIFGNALALIYCILIAVKLSQPQVFICLIDLLVLFVLSLIQKKNVHC